MNIRNKKSVYRRRVLVATLIYILDAIRVPFALIALPNRWLVRRIKALCEYVARLTFVEKGMCAGCSRYGTRRCHTHSKNPYAVIGMDRGCYIVD